MTTATRFHLSQLVHHTVGLLRSAAGLPEPAPRVVRLPDLRDGLHPSDLCCCVCGPDAPGLKHDAHCPWVRAMCANCRGTGWCASCRGSGCA